MRGLSGGEDSAIADFIFVGRHYIEGFEASALASDHRSEIYIYSGLVVLRHAGKKITLKNQINVLNLISHFFIVK